MYKIKRLHAYLVILAALFAQILLSKFLGHGILKPNLMIVATIFLALFTDEKFGFEIGLLSGIFLDILSIRFFGLNAILFALGGYLVGRYNTKFYRDSIITHITLTFLLSFFILSLYLLAVSLRSPSPPRLILNVIFGPLVIIPSLINSFLGIWAYAFLSRIFQLSESAL